MSGDRNSDNFILGLIVVAIVIAIVVCLLNWLYRRSSKERAFVRTGFGGQKVVLNGGAFVLPIVHEVIPVNMNTLRLEVSRGREHGADHQATACAWTYRRVLRARAGRPRRRSPRPRRRSASAPCSPSC